MKRNIKILGVALIAAVLVVLGLGTTVFADTADGTLPAEGTTCYGHGLYGEAGVCSDALSELLDLTPEEIHEQRLAGVSLVEIAAARGVDADTLVATLVAEKTAAINALVADGTITQEQADAMLAVLEARTIEMVNSTTPGGFGIRARSGNCNGTGGAAYGMGGYGARSQNGTCGGTGLAGTGMMNRFGGRAR